MPHLYTFIIVFSLCASFGTPDSLARQTTQESVATDEKEPMNQHGHSHAQEVTRHHGKSNREPNRLADETSPYLLQHAYNPVDWYPWGDEAFEAARQQDKPIFLSVGYSTCYWCHVMERESFESEEIAAIMNEKFICVKVDREERPDVDDIYMTSVQLMTGSGGWPMSVFIEPQSLKPFVGGTYFPPEDRYGRPGFPNVLTQINNYWINQRDQIIAQADRIAQAVSSQYTQSQQPVPLDQRIVQEAVTTLLSTYDSDDGGFVGGREAPKFPTPVNIDFLLVAGWENESVNRAVIHTLDRMAMGGMYDQIGGGFHRYSVDAKWLVPHFEKMLYDNGQLATTYARAFELTTDPYYAEIVREINEYVLREMTDAGGAFYSAQDAEVNAREGQNYIWTEAELREAMLECGLDDLLEFAIEVYGFSKGTNFQDPHHPEDGRKNVVYLIDKPAVLAQQMNLSLEDFNSRVTRINEKLLEVRDRRDQPGTDDKILTGWNGLMIAGMADGGRVLDEPQYVNAAKTAAAFILDKMRTDDGGLLRSYREGKSKIDAFLEDYAFFVRGLISLHRATDDNNFLTHAEELVQEAHERFWDKSNGAYFDTLANQSDLFVRVKSTYDGAVPCGNSVMLNNLVDLYELTQNEEYLTYAIDGIKALSSTISRRALGTVTSTLALHRILQVRPDAFKQVGTVEVVQIPTPKSKIPVQIQTSANEVQLSRETPTEVQILLRIEDGFHINSHSPGDELLIPLSVDMVGGDGISLSVEYPQGESYKAVYAKNEIFIHDGFVVIPVSLRQSGASTGDPKLIVTYQVCTDKECLEPQKKILDLQIIPES